MDEGKLHDSLDRVAASALAWRAKAERYETALMLIAAYKDKTLLGPEADLERFYSQGAHAAFADAAAIAEAAIAGDRDGNNPEDATTGQTDVQGFR